SKPPSATACSTTSLAWANPFPGATSRTIHIGGFAQNFGTRSCNSPGHKFGSNSSCRPVSWLAMKQLYSARTGLEAHDIRLFLEARGINAIVYGETGLEVGFSFTPASAPSVYVDESSFETAQELLSDYWETLEQTPSRSNWTCSHCGEVVGGQFDACWN